MSSGDARDAKEIVENTVVFGILKIFHGVTIDAVVKVSVRQTQAVK